MDPIDVEPIITWAFAFYSSLPDWIQWCAGIAACGVMAFVVSIMIMENRLGQQMSYCKQCGALLRNGIPVGPGQHGVGYGWETQEWKQKEE